MATDSGAVHNGLYFPASEEGEYFTFCLKLCLITKGKRQTYINITGKVEFSGSVKVEFSGLPNLTLINVYL